MQGTMPQTNAKAPLAGVKVVDFCWAIAGATFSGMLANWGATVVRIESKRAVDFNRENPPFAPGDGWLGDRSAFWANVGNSGKMSLQLNMKHPRAREVLDRLIGWGDVVTENFAGGKMADYKLAYTDIVKTRPDIIMVSASMYGQTGPWSHLRGNGTALVSQAGFAQITGYPDEAARHPGFVYSDFFVPKLLTLACVSALDYKRRTGKGQYLDVAQLETAMGYLAPALMMASLDGTELQRVGHAAPEGFSPNGVYKCAGDFRWCAISVVDEEAWAGLKRAMGEPEWMVRADWDTVEGRRQDETEISEGIAAWTRDIAAEDVAERLQKNRVAAAVLKNGADLLADPQLNHRGYYFTREHPCLGEFKYSGMPAILPETPCEPARSPLLGEHTRDVCCDLLGFSASEFDDLQEAGVFE